MLKTLSEHSVARCDDASPPCCRHRRRLGRHGGGLRLRAKGYRVTLFDRGPMLGGRAQVFQKDGFRYDAGPTVITAHFLFEELFALFGRRMEDYVTLVPLNPWYRFRFPDGDTFDYGGSIEDTLAEIRRFRTRRCRWLSAPAGPFRKAVRPGIHSASPTSRFTVPWTMLPRPPPLCGLAATDTCGR